MLGTSLGHHANIWVVENEGTTNVSSDNIHLIHMYIMGNSRVSWAGGALQS